MVKYYDKSTNNIFEITSYSLNQNMSTLSQPQVETILILHCSKSDINCINYINKLIKDITTSINGVHMLKKDFARDIYLLNDNNTVMELLSCFLKNVIFDVNDKYFEVEFYVDYYIHHFEGNEMYDLISKIKLESRRNKLDDLLGLSVQ